MENQPNTRRHSQIDREPPTYKETVITGASKHAVLYNVVSNLFWALLDLLISIWRFGFGRQKPSTTVSGNQAVSGNTRDQNGSFPVGNTPQKHARKKVEANSSNSSTNAKSSPSQTQITKDDKPKDDQKPSTTVSGNQAVSGNTRDQNGSFPVGKTPQKHARKKVKANSSNSFTNVKSSPSQTQITNQKPSTTVSGNQAVSGNTRDQNGSFPVGNTPQKHARKKVKANSSNSSTNAKSSPPPQTQITRDDKPKDDLKPSTTVSGNQAVSGNTRDQNGSFPVGNSSNSSTNAKSSPPSQTQITKDGKPRDVQKPSITVSDNQVSRNTGDDNGRFSVGNARKKDKASSSNSSTSARLSRPSQTQISKDDKPEGDRKPCIVVSGNQINDNKGHGNGIFSVGNT